MAYIKNGYTAFDNLFNFIFTLLFEGCVTDRELLLSLALGIPGSPVFISQWFLAFTAFVGANLLQSALTKWCLLESILRKIGVQPGC